jgi:hypothetical protein
VQWLCRDLVVARCLWVLLPWAGLQWLCAPVVIAILERIHKLHVHAWNSMQTWSYVTLLWPPRIDFSVIYKCMHLAKHDVTEPSGCILHTWFFVSLRPALCPKRQARIAVFPWPPILSPQQSKLLIEFLWCLV